LFLGTHQDNMTDMAAKGRAGGVRGEHNYNARLTEQDVIAIRNDTRLRRVIAEDYPVNRQRISSIKTRRSWGHLKLSI
jgi:hypothetical protein